MKKLYATLKGISIIIFLINASVAFAQPGFLDPTFGNGGKVVTVVDTFNVFGADMVIQPDGKILVTATQALYNLTCVARYNVDGSLDNSFGNNGIATYSPGFGYINSQCIALQSDGKILTGGRTFSLNNPSSALLMRYNPDGSIDSSFGNNGFVSTYVGSAITGITKIIIKPDGKILTTIDSHDGLAHLIQYKSTGIPDSSFGQNGIANSPVYPALQGSIVMTDLKLQSDGKIVASGSASFSSLIAIRFQENGIIDSSFGNVGLAQFSQYEFGQGISVQTDGKLILTGITNNQKIVVIRLNNDGSLDNSFGTAGSSIVDLDTLPNYVGFPFIQPDGKILVPATNFSRRFVPGVGFDGIRDNNYSGDFVLLRFKTNGTLDSSFGVNGKIVTDFGLDDFAYAVSVQSDGKVLIAGGASDSTKYNIGLARYNFNALPLKLLTFTAKKQDNTNLLQWTTAQEVNVDRFEIERAGPLSPQRGELEAPSNSPGGGELKFVSIGVIPSKAKAGSTGILSYNYTDVAPPFGGRGGFFYRLRMIDRDGKFTYSPVRMVENKTSFSVSIYPNPAKDKLQVQINSDRKTVLQMQVLSLDGKVLLKSSFTAGEGYILRSININTLPKGIYYLQVVSLNRLEGREAVVKFEKM